jgi:dienelactone hydrolase
MRVLFCLYDPSRGGVQEFMRQVAERLALAGHDVTVAASHLPARQFSRPRCCEIDEQRLTEVQINTKVLPDDSMRLRVVGLENRPCSGWSL